MKKYCRYCTNLVCGDVPYCQAKKQVRSEASCKIVVQCNDFELNPIDAFGENLRGYVPRKKKEIAEDCDCENLSLF